MSVIFNAFGSLVKHQKTIWCYQWNVKSQAFQIASNMQAGETVLIWIYLDENGIDWRIRNPSMFLVIIIISRFWQEKPSDSLIHT